MFFNDVSCYLLFTTSPHCATFSMASQKSRVFWKRSADCIESDDDDMLVSKTSSRGSVTVYFGHGMTSPVDVRYVGSLKTRRQTIPLPT